MFVRVSRPASRATCEPAAVRFDDAARSDPSGISRRDQPEIPTASIAAAHRHFYDRVAASGKGFAPDMSSKTISVHLPFFAGRPATLPLRAG